MGERSRVRGATQGRSVGRQRREQRSRVRVGWKGGGEAVCREDKVVTVSVSHSWPDTS